MDPFANWTAPLALALFAAAVGALTYLTKRVKPAWWQAGIGHQLVDLVPYAWALLLGNLVWLLDRVAPVVPAESTMVPAGWSYAYWLVASLCLAAVAEAVFNKWKRRWGHSDATADHA